LHILKKDIMGVTKRRKKHRAFLPLLLGHPGCGFCLSVLYIWPSDWQEKNFDEVPHHMKDRSK